MHGIRIQARKTYLFAFLDDHSRLLPGYRWGYGEDTVRLAAALRPALAARGVPKAIYVDRGSAFVDEWLLRACAKLSVRLVHSAPYRPEGRGKVGVRGIHHRIVASLGGQPLTHHATLAPRAADALAAEHAERGRTPTVIVEEAHLLGHDQLEAIRLLTNHDLDSSSPFACLLVGQPTLRRRMKLGVLAALDQRIGLRYTMPPMTDKETASYLRHHLALAGRDDTLFSDDAVGLIHQTSRGYPRAVNNLALQALVAAFGANKAIVDESSTRTAIAEVTAD